MTHVSLFSGIGGLDLAAEWAGFRTVLQVERDPYCLRVLEKHWPDVPRITDIREVTSESVDGPVTVVSGGFPCQPFSQAGKRRGTDDDRYLWPEMLRVVRELSPAYVVAENVSGLLSLDGGVVFERVLSDLERAGHEVLPFHYPAASVGAPHRRDRVFIVAHADKHGEPRRAEYAGPGCGELVPDVADSDGVQMERQRAEQQTTGAFGEGKNMADTEGGTERTRLRQDESPEEWRRRPGHSGGAGYCWAAEPNVGGAPARLPRWMDGGRLNANNPWDGEWELHVPRTASGVPARVDRLRALGNAVVPQQAYPTFATIAEAVFSRAE